MRPKKKFRTRLLSFAKSGEIGLRHFAETLRALSPCVSRKYGNVLVLFREIVWENVWQIVSHRDREIYGKMYEIRELNSYDGTIIWWFFLKLNVSVSMSLVLIEFGVFQCKKDRIKFF